MADRRIPEQHRARSRDRSDQRRPTFQVLNAVQPRTHTHGKRNLSHYAAEPHHTDYDKDKNMIESDNYESQIQKRLIGMNTLGGYKSSESVASSYRSPACNFRANNNSDAINEGNRTQSVSPGRMSPGPVGRPRSQSPQDRIVLEEPSDLVVWNASKKASRSNLLCPLTESEFRNINVMDTKVLRAPRPRSKSLPTHHHSHNNHQRKQQRIAGVLEARNSVIFNVDNLCKEAAELLDDFAPPPTSPTEISPTASVASTTYSLQISLVTQQLEEIQQAQNDVLKHLGEEIAKVTDENERLKKEVDHVRDQNEGLLKVVHDTTDELERMKHIFRSRSLSHPTPQTHQRNQQGDLIEGAPLSSSSPPPTSLQHQHSHNRSIKHQGGKRDRDSLNSNSNNKKAIMGDGDTIMTHLIEASIGNTGENAEMAPGKKHKTKKIERNKQQYHHQIDVSIEDQEMDLIRDLDFNGENVSNRSIDSHVKSPRGRRQEDPHSHRHHGHSHHHPHSHTHGHDDHELRRRSRSKERHGSKSPRSSNCYEQDGKKIKQVVNKPVVYRDECNDDMELNQSSGGCLRGLVCCFSSSRSKSKTDNVDDMVLQGCPE